MNDNHPAPTPPAEVPAPAFSSVYRLCEEVIALRETNNRQHKVFEQALARAREALEERFNTFAADTYRAHQQLRQELHAEKRITLALLQELLAISTDLENIMASRPPSDDAVEFNRWGDSVAVETRNVYAALQRHGVHPYDAVVGSPYNPALHERVGGRRLEGMEPLRVAEQRERGYASQQPEFVLRRPKVIVSE